MEEVQFIACEGLSIGYRDPSDGVVLVKSAISLKALKGEMVTLIGGNGVGKSTLLKTIAGFQPPLSGQLLIHQKAIYQYRPVELSRQMSFVSTENVKLSNLTVEELVGLGRYPYTNWFGMLEEEDHCIIKEAIRKVGLSGYENRMLNFISDGERQRAMIARALAQDTNIIVLDEPTAFLDIANKYEIMQILHQLVNQEGKCVILSSHDFHTALAMSDRIWLMLKGEVVEGIPEDIAAKGYFSALFPANQHLDFDEEVGDFRIRRSARATIRLTAEPQSRKWVVKALERLGFSVDASPNKEGDSGNKEAEIRVSQQIEGWKVTYRDAQLETVSLETLCRELKHLATEPKS